MFQIQNDELDRLTLVALEIIMGYFCLTVARQMEEVLHGKLYNPSEELKNEVAMTPTTNSVSERVFGSFDRYMREKPNATTLNLESTILFETNKTSSWLNGLDTSTKNLYLDIARKSARGVIKDYQIHRKDIDERIRQNLLLKQKKTQEKERETLNKTRSIIDSVQKLGGEWTLDNFEEKLRNLKDPSKQRTAIINQLKYHKFVLKSKCDNKSKFQQSAQGRAFTLQVLKKNLLYIITVNAEGDQQQVIDDTKRQPDEIQERLKLAKKSIKSKLDKFNSRKKHNKKNVSKNKVAANRLMPEDLVNKNVDHIFDVKDNDGQVTQIAYSGFITRIVKKHKDPKQTLFEIVYDSVYNNDDESDDDE